MHEAELVMSTQMSLMHVAFSMYVWENNKPTIPTMFLNIIILNLLDYYDTLQSQPVVTQSDGLVYLWLAM